MIEEIKNIKSEKNDLKSFGFIFGTIFLIISGFLFWKEKESFQIFFAIGISLFLTAIAIPIILKPFFWIWMIFAIILGWFMTRVILSLLFYMVFTLTRLVSLLFRKRFLEKGWDTSKRSYWNYREKQQAQTENYERQF